MYSKRNRPTTPITRRQFQWKPVALFSSLSTNVSGLFCRVVRRSDSRRALTLAPSSPNSNPVDFCWSFQSERSYPRKEAWSRRVGGTYWSLELCANPLYGAPTSGSSHCCFFSIPHTFLEVRRVNEIVLCGQLCWKAPRVKALLTAHNTIQQLQREMLITAT